MTAPTLLPCPFCGGPVTLEEAKSTRDPMFGLRRWWGVVCRNTENLGGSCAIQQRPSASEEAATERWNRRAAPAEPPKPVDETIKTRVAVVMGKAIALAKAYSQPPGSGGFAEAYETLERYVEAAVRDDAFPGFGAAQLSAPAALEAAEAKAARLWEALEKLIRAYVARMETDRDRMVYHLGWQCEPLEVMEHNDPYLQAARAVLAATSPTVTIDGPESFRDLEEASKRLNDEISAAGGLEAWRASQAEAARGDGGDARKALADAFGILDDCGRDAQDRVTHAMRVLSAATG